MGRIETIPQNYKIKHYVTEQICSREQDEYLNLVSISLQDTKIEKQTNYKTKMSALNITEPYVLQHVLQNH